MKQHEHFKFSPGVIAYPVFFVLSIWLVFWFEVRFGFNLSKYAEEHVTYHEDKHISCFSYPNCDEAPSGCNVRSAHKSKSTLHIGGDVEHFGHKG